MFRVHDSPTHQLPTLLACTQQDAPYLQRRHIQHSSASATAADTRCRCHRVRLLLLPRLPALLRPRLRLRLRLRLQLLHQQPHLRACQLVAPAVPRLHGKPAVALSRHRAVPARPDYSAGGGVRRPRGHSQQIGRVTHVLHAWWVGGGGSAGCVNSG